MEKTEVLDMWTNPKYWPEPVVVNGMEENIVVEPTEAMYQLSLGEIPSDYDELLEEITQDPRVTYFEKFDSRAGFSIWVIQIGPRTYQMSCWHHDQVQPYVMKRWLTLGQDLDVDEYKKGRKDSENDYAEGWYGTEISNKTLKQLIQTSVGDEYTDDYYEGFFEWTNELRRQQQLAQRG